MAITLTGGTGLFDRLGKIGYLLSVINARFGGSSANDFPTELNDILVTLDGTANYLRDTVDHLTPAHVAFQLTPGTFRTALRTAAQNILIEMAHADNPLPSKTVEYALDELIYQMRTSIDSVDANEPTIASLVDGPQYGTITAATQANPCVVTSAAHGLSNGDVVSIKSVGGMTQINNLEFTVSNVATNTFELNGTDSSGYGVYTTGGKWRANYGNGQIVLSLKNGKGQTLENCLAEDILVTITDSDTAANETASIRGEVVQSDKLNHSWPDGSGASTELTVQDPASDGFLTNGDFEDFTVANTPDNWTIVVGAAGSSILRTTTKYSGTYALQYVGDGVTLQQITQAVSDAESRTPYPVSVRYRVSAAAGAGVLVIDLYDGTNVINDDAGTANSLTIALTSATTTYRVATATFRLPERVPSTVTLRVRLTTALTAAISVYIDDVILGDAMVESYVGGPYIAKIAGSVNMGLDDRDVVTVTNDRRGAFVGLFDQLFLLPEKLLPSNSAGTETILDSLLS